MKPSGKQSPPLWPSSNFWSSTSIQVFGFLVFYCFDIIVFIYLFPDGNYIISFHLLLPMVRTLPCRYASQMDTFQLPLLFKKQMYLRNMLVKAGTEWTEMLPRGFTADGGTLQSIQTTLLLHPAPPEHKHGPGLWWVMMIGGMKDSLEQIGSGKGWRTSTIWSTAGGRGVGRDLTQRGGARIWSKMKEEVEAGRKTWAGRRGGNRREVWGWGCRNTTRRALRHRENKN